MNKEEALDILAKQEFHFDKKEDADRFCEAYNMAFKELEQEPCDDAISRQVAIEKIHWLGLDNDTATMCDLAIRALPPVTPKQRKGHWIDGSNWWMCSECKWDNTFDTNYCPNCGAKMDGVGYVDIPDKKNDWYDVPSDEMTLEQARQSVKDLRKKLIEYLEQEPKTEQFAKWVATEIFDDMWEYNIDAFGEIACRKLAKLGIVRAKGDEWELVEPQESEVE